MSWHLRAETTVDASQSVVWAVLTDFDAYPEWNPSLRVRGRPVEGSRLWALLVDPGLPSVPFRPLVTGVEPRRELRWRTRLPLGTVTAEHVFRVEPTARGARLVQTERFRGVAADPVLNRLSPAIRRTFERMNDALAARAETLAADLPDDDTDPQP